MKYNITITDMNEKQFQETVCKLNGSSDDQPLNLEQMTQTLEETGKTLTDMIPVETPDAVTTVQEQVVETPAPVVETVTVGDAVAADADGFPWDARIHSSNKKQKADGTWHKKKGCDINLWNSVRAELQANGAPPMPVATAPVVEQPVAPPMPVATAPVVEQPVAPVQPVAVPQPTVAAPVQPPAANGGDFTALLTKVQQGMQAGTIDATYMQSIVTRLNVQFTVNLNAITDIMQHQHMIDAAFAYLVQDGK